MFHGSIVAEHELNTTEATAEQEIARGPIAGIVLALPISLALWAVIIGVSRLWF